MSGNTMNKFVYVSDDYRRAWEIYINNSQGLKHWEEFDNDFKTEFDFKIREEQAALKEVHRPPTWYLNDKLGEKEYLFNMSQDFYPRVDYEYTDNLPSYEDLMMNRAIQIRDMGKEIELLYSGGLDSVAALFALYEVCPTDQIKIIVSGDECFENYWDGYKKIVGHMNWEYSLGNLFGASRPDKYIFTTGCEADRLLGSTGYPGSRYTNTEQYTTSEDDYEYNHNSWWNITRLTRITQSFRFLQNIKVDKFPIENYQPFFLCPQLERYAINKNIDRKVIWYADFWTAPEDFLKCKMELRNFIAKWDKNYAYSTVKTNMPFSVQKEILSPLPNNFNVLAITDDGTVVNKNNIMSYLDTKYLTI